MSFPAYPSYRDSGIEWLALVPTHWELGKLGRISRSGMGQTILKEMLEPSETPDALPVYSASEAAAAFGFLSAPAIVLVPGDLIVGARGSIGMTRRVTERCTCTQTTIWVRPNTGAVDSAFLYWAMVAGRSAIFPFDKTAIPMLTVEEVRAAPLCFPPADEQAAIAAFLDRETARIDVLIEEQQRMIELLNEQLIALALPKLDGDWARLGEVAELQLRPLSLEGGQKYEALGLFNRGRGLFHKDARDGLEMGDSDFFWVKEGDLILSGQFAWEGAVAMAGPDEEGCVVSHRYPIIRGKSGRARTEFLFAILASQFGDHLLNENSRGAAGRNRPLNIQSLLKEKVPLIPMEQQDRVSAMLRERTAISRAAAQQVSLLQERRSALISAAVTGKIDVRGLTQTESQTEAT